MKLNQQVVFFGWKKNVKIYLKVQKKICYILHRTEHGRTLNKLIAQKDSLVRV